MAEKVFNLTVSHDAGDAARVCVRDPTEGRLLLQPWSPVKTKCIHMLHRKQRRILVEGFMSDADFFSAFTRLYLTGCCTIEGDAKRIPAV